MFLRTIGIYVRVFKVSFWINWIMLLHITVLFLLSPGLLPNAMNCFIQNNEEEGEVVCMFCMFNYFLSENVTVSKFWFSTI